MVPVSQTPYRIMRILPDQRKEIKQKRTFVLFCLHRLPKTDKEAMALEREGRPYRSVLGFLGQTHQEPHPRTLLQRTIAYLP